MSFNDEHRKSHSSQTLLSELSGVQNSLKALHESTVALSISLNPQLVSGTFILLIPGSTCATGMLCLQTFKYECGKQRLISFLSNNRIKILRHCMELTVDTMLNITYTNISTPFYECNTYPGNSSKYFFSNQRFE